MSEETPIPPEASEISSSTSSEEPAMSRFRTRLPAPLYETYHGEDSEAEVEEELREREMDYGFRASRARPFPSSSSSPGSQTRRVSPTMHADGGALQFHQGSSNGPVAHLPPELYSLIAGFALSERAIAKIHTFRKSPWRIIVGASLASKAMRAAIMQAWFRVLRIRQVGDFNFIDQKMPWMFPWVREVHWHYRFPITCNETHVLPKFIHAVLISFKTSDNRLGNEHYMTMVHKAMPYLGSIPTLTRLSLTCRSLLDQKFLSNLAACWPGLECLRLARPLKDDNDPKAYVLYRYDFHSVDDVIHRLVSCLGGLQKLAYIAIDLAFVDFRAMRTAHATNAAAPVIPDHVVLPKSLQPHPPSQNTDADGDTIMNDSPTMTPLTNNVAALNVSGNANGLPANPIASTSLPSFPTSHNPNCAPLECPYCRRSFRAHSYYLEHDVAMGLGQGLSSLAAVRFRASFPETDAGDARENKWLIRRGTSGDTMARFAEEEDVVEVWAPRWE